MIVADIGADLPGYTLPLLDALPFQTVLALWHQAGRLRKRRLRDQAVATRTAGAKVDDWARFLDTLGDA